MSLPEFPNSGQTVTREEALNLIISSIAMEELGLSHIINAEGEKLQYALGTLNGEGGIKEPLTVNELLEINKSIVKTLDSAMMNQFLLKEKLSKALSASVIEPPAHCPLSIIPFSTQSVVVDTDEQGNAVNLSPLSFGYYYPTIPIDTDKTVTMDNVAQASIILPYDAVIKSIYFSAGNTSPISGTGTFYPFIELYAAAADSKVFTPIAGSAVMPLIGITLPAQQDQITTASAADLDIRLSAGTRLLISGKIRSEEETAQNLMLFFAGGIAICPQQF